jgi:NADH-quinone oxidoreductase subunit N
MNVLLTAMLPEIILSAMACVLILLGVSTRTFSRRLAGTLALLTLIVIFLIQFFATRSAGDQPLLDQWGTVRIDHFSNYIKLLAAGVGILLVLLNMPTNADGTGGSAANFGTDTGEFFGLLLLSLAGLFIVASANDIILLFLGIELASIPTYIMVSISRPLPVAQEAGVKYFFLGAMSAAVMLFGFSYLYGTTGLTGLESIGTQLANISAPGRAELSHWQLLAALMLIAGFAFKIAAVPMHVYAGDVYQGAATPVTAFLAFVPKTSGFVALIKVLYAVGGNSWAVPLPLVKLLWVLAVLTMTCGNVLGLLQFNVKRVLAYSSIAHTGYMLAGVTALISTTDPNIQSESLQGVLFYLAAYGIMNVGAFGVLQLLPSRTDRPATSAETYEDLAGQGRKHVALGLAMAVACFSLTGLPLTIGFFGKLYLIKPALHANLTGLVVILVINAAISAAYYLRIVAAMFLRPEPTHFTTTGPAPNAIARLIHPAPVVIAVLLSVIGTLGLGVFIPATGSLGRRALQAAGFEARSASPPLATTSGNEPTGAGRQIP